MALTDHVLDRYFSNKLSDLIVGHLGKNAFYAIPNPSLHTVSIYCHDTEVFEFAYERAFILLVMLLTKGWEVLDTAVSRRVLEARER